MLRINFLFDEFDVIELFFKPSKFFFRFSASFLWKLFETYFFVFLFFLKFFQFYRK